MTFKTVTPAKAGAHLEVVVPSRIITSWVPAFAGTTQGARA